MAWMAAGASVLKSLGGSFGAKKKAKQDQKDSLEQIRAKGLEGLKQIEFQNASDYYYQQLGKQEKMRGLDQFRKFSTVKNFAPDFVDTNPGPQVPTMPTAAAEAAVGAPPASTKKSSNGGIIGAALGGLAGYLLGR